MSSVKRILGAGIFFVLIFTACEQIPSHIIAPEQMETLLIDIHKAEAISDNLTQYASDREKERLRQSVFDRHHVTQAQFDTSLVWYSEHMTKYSQIYNNVTARLKEEDDSIDVWNKDPYYLFEPRLYRHVLLFNILADDNFRENDIFQLSINFDQLPQGIPDKARITLVIRHRNDSIYSVTREILHNGTTMIEAQAQNDKVTRVMGSIEVPLHPMWQETYANKISLLRIRHKNRPNVPKSAS